MNDALASVLIVAAVIAIVQAARIALRPRAHSPAGTRPAPNAVAMPTQRPLGVAAIALLYFFASFWCLLISFLSAASPSTLRALLRLLGGSPHAGGGMIDALVAVARLPLAYLFGLTAVVLLVGGRSVGMAAFLAALGFGMWRPQNWARLTTMAMAALPLIQLLLAVRRVNSVSGALSLAASLAVAAGVIFYLFRPGVRAAFHASTT